MSLTDTQIKNAKPQSKTYRVSDGAGLFIEIRPNGSKLWRYQFRLSGKQKLLALGSYPEDSLHDVRVDLLAARKLVKKKIDPVHHRQNQKSQLLSDSEKTFKALAEAWIKKKSQTDCSEKYVQQIERTFLRYIYPKIGKRPISSLNAVDILRVLEAMESARTLAMMARQWMSGVFRYAIVRRLAEIDPASMLRGEITRPKPKRKKPLSPQELPGFLKAIDEYGTRSQVQSTTVVALKLLLLTFVRTGELRQARWSEIDWEAKLWRIPAERMKMGRDHLVPLSNQAVRLLKELKRLTGRQDWLFPNTRRPKKCMSTTSINRALGFMGYGGRLSAHAFRNTASTILHEKGYNTDHIELQLAHDDRTVRGRYNSANYLVERTQMMQDWADLLDQYKQIQSDQVANE